MPGRRAAVYARAEGCSKNVGEREVGKAEDYWDCLFLEVKVKCSKHVWQSS